MRGFGFLKRLGAILSAIISPLVTMSCHSNEAKDLYGPPALDDDDMTYSADILHEGIDPVDNGRQVVQGASQEQNHEVEDKTIIQDEVNRISSAGVEEGADKKEALEEALPERAAGATKTEQASSEENDNLDAPNAESTNKKIKVLKKSSKKCPACGVYGPPTPRRHQ